MRYYVIIFIFHKTAVRTKFNELKNIFWLNIVEYCISEIDFN